MRQPARPAPSQRFSLHEKRLDDLESQMGAVTNSNELLALEVAQVNKTLASLLPHVMKAVAHSKSLRVVRKGGLWGLLVAAGGLLESYGPDIAKAIGKLLVGH